MGGLRSIDGVLESIKSGIPREIWELIKTECDGEIGLEPLTKYVELRRLSFRQYRSKRRL